MAVTSAPFTKPRSKMTERARPHYTYKTWTINDAGPGPTDVDLKVRVTKKYRDGKDTHSYHGYVESFGDVLTTFMGTGDTSGLDIALDHLRDYRRDQI